MSSVTRPRLGVLTSPLPAIHGLLLQSIQGTHADVLQFGALSKSIEQGVEVVSGDFVHTPSGKRYVISVVQIEPQAQEPRS